MTLSEFIESAHSQLNNFKQAHEDSQAVEGVSLYPEAMSEDEWWESLAKYRFHVNF